MPSPPWIKNNGGYERIVASELSAHRCTLQQMLQEWSAQQDAILEGAVSVLMQSQGQVNGEGAHSNGAQSNGVFHANGNWTSGGSSGNDTIVQDPGAPLQALDVDPAVMSQLKGAWIARDNMRMGPEDPSVLVVAEGYHPARATPSPPSSKEMVSGQIIQSSTFVIEENEEEIREQIKSQASFLGFQRKRTEGLTFLNQHGRLGSCASSIVHSKRFETTCACVIMLNAVLLGVSSDYAMDHLHNPDHPALSAIELAFSIFYFVEVCLRISVFGRSYCTSADWKWNMFDFALVAMSVWDQIEARLDVFGGGSAMKNLSFLRMLRLMKMLKLLRMVRLMRMFRELRLILHSVLGCVQAMFWAMVLIITISYMFGICFLQACTSYLQSISQDQLDPADAELISEYWSSILAAMLSLYLAATAGKEWAVISQPLKRVGWPFYLLFLVYIAFFAFVVMNTVTGLFLEATLAHSDKDQHMVIQMELDKKEQYIDKLQAFYDEMDDDKDGEISYEEFCRHLHSPEMRAFAASLEIDVLDAKQFFCILSDHGRRSVDVETFVVGCIKLKGAARSMDLMDLVYAHREAHSEMRFFCQSTECTLQSLQEKLDHVEANMQQSSLRLGRASNLQKARTSLLDWTPNPGEKLATPPSTKASNDEATPGSQKTDDEAGGQCQV